MARNLLIFGPPGAGKGTQAARVKAALGIPHVSTGDMFREHLRRKTELGVKVEEILAAGKLVPDSVTNQMVEERLGRPDAAAGVLLDGYPRNVAQARFLDELLRARGDRLEAVLEIQVPEAELLRRMLGRARSEGRADDADPEIVRRRIQVYQEETRPCLDHYRSSGTRIHAIDGAGDVDTVTRQILDCLHR